MRTNERRNARLLVNTAQALTRFLGGSNGKEKP
jgi:hypothetical protein